MTRCTIASITDRIDLPKKLFVDLQEFLNFNPKKVPKKMPKAMSDFVLQL